MRVVGQVSNIGRIMFIMCFLGVSSEDNDHAVRFRVKIHSIATIFVGIVIGSENGKAQRVG